MLFYSATRIRERSFLFRGCKSLASFCVLMVGRSLYLLCLFLEKGPFIFPTSVPWEDGHTSDEVGGASNRHHFAREATTSVPTGEEGRRKFCPNNYKGAKCVTIASRATTGVFRVPRVYPRHFKRLSLQPSVEHCAGGHTRHFSCIHTCLFFLVRRIFLFSVCIPRVGCGCSGVLC